MVSGKDRQRRAQLVAQYPQRIGPEARELLQLPVLLLQLVRARANLVLQLRVDALEPA